MEQPGFHLCSIETSETRLLQTVLNVVFIEITAIIVSLTQIWNLSNAGVDVFSVQPKSYFLVKLCE